MEDSLRKMHAHRLMLARDVVAHAKNGTTAQAEDVLQEEVAFYLDPEMYEKEYRRFFRETPLVACLSSDLPDPGSFRLFDDTGVPVLVWRGKDGQVRAFLNICAHRGARVARESCGKAARLTCRFHGWTYDTTGRAVAIPEKAQFLDKIDAQQQLVAVPAEERHGLVFVQVTPGSTMDLDAHLGEFGQELELLCLRRAQPVVEDELTAKSNWKYTLDTYFENYHLPVLHRDTFAHVIAHNLASFETWGPHHRFVFAHTNVPQWMNKPEQEWPIDTCVPITYFLFPNVSIAVGSASPSGSLISIHRLFPRSVGELHTKIAIYAPPGVRSEEEFAEIRQNFQKLKEGVRDEDYSVTDESYGALAELPRGARFPIGRLEIGVQNFHRNVRLRLEA